jgi:hypothetical protein
MDRTTSLAVIRLRELQGAAQKLTTLTKNFRLRAIAGIHPSAHNVRHLADLAERTASMAYELADDVGRGIDPPPVVVVREGPHNSYKHEGSSRAT